MAASTFDQASGIRERLALLAAIGPLTIEPSAWGYNPSRDLWYYCGGARQIQGVVRVPVSQEGAKSLELIHHKFKMSREQAMAFIGYPEGGRS